MTILHGKLVQRQRHISDKNDRQRAPPRPRVLRPIRKGLSYREHRTRAGSWFGSDSHEIVIRAWWPMVR